MLEFTDRVVGTVNVPIDITESDIECIIVGSFEGGSSWFIVDNTTEVWSNKPKGEPVSTWATKILIDGGIVRLCDTYDDDTMLDLTLDKVLEGIKLNNTKRPKCSDKDNWDATDYDCIIQYALLGEVEYD